jgi:hypothetical protein
MEKIPQPNKENERRDGFVVGEAGEAIPAQYVLSDFENIKIPKREQANFRKIGGSMKLYPKNTEKSEDMKLKIGDLVQWISSDAHRWESPKKIKSFSNDKKFAFFEGSPTGIPMEQLSPVKE